MLIRPSVIEPIRALLVCVDHDSTFLHVDGQIFQHYYINIEIVLFHYLNTVSKCLHKITPNFHTTTKSLPSKYIKYNVMQQIEYVQDVKIPVNTFNRNLSFK